MMKKSSFINVTKDERNFVIGLLASNLSWGNISSFSIDVLR